MGGIYHGGKLDHAIKQYGGNPEDWLDLSTGINPSPYPVPEMPIGVWSRLPDGEAQARLLEVARSYYGVPKGFEIVAAPGTQSLIELLPQWLNANPLSIVAPTYGEYDHVWKKHERRTIAVSDLGEIADGSTAIVVNPNNPTGKVFPARELFELADRLNLLIIDEAFCDPVPEVSVVPNLPENVLVLKSFGKFFGLAGIRLGFAIGSASLIQKIELHLGPWAVSGPALHVAKEALSDEGWIEQSRQVLPHASSELADVFVQHGIEVIGQNALFVYVRHAHAGKLFDHLAQNHILARPFSDQPERLRFGLCGNQHELARLSRALGSFQHD